MQSTETHTELFFFVFLFYNCACRLRSTTNTNSSQPPAPSRLCSTIALLRSGQLPRPHVPRSGYVSPRARSMAAITLPHGRSRQWPDQPVGVRRATLTMAPSRIATRIPALGLELVRADLFVDLTITLVIPLALVDPARRGLRRPRLPGSASRNLPGPIQRWTIPHCSAADHSTQLHILVALFVGTVPPWVCPHTMVQALSDPVLSPPLEPSPQPPWRITRPYTPALFPLEILHRPILRF